MLNENNEQNTRLAWDVVFFLFQPIVDDSELFFDDGSKRIVTNIVRKMWARTRTREGGANRVSEKKKKWDSRNKDIEKEEREKRSNVSGYMWRTYGTLFW